MSPAPNGWLTGRSKNLGTPHSQDLLTTNIVDAWLCPLHEAPSEGEDLTIFHLCQLPLQLLVFPDHPLLKRVDLTLDQVKEYPLEHIPPKAYPGTERVLQSLDFSPLRKTKKQTKQLGASQQANASTLHLGSVLRHDQDKPKLVPLPLRLNVSTGVALVTRREHSTTTAIRDLRTDLEQRLKDFQLMHPEVQLIGSTANRPGRAERNKHLHRMTGCWRNGQTAHKHFSVPHAPLQDHLPPASTWKTIPAWLHRHSCWHWIKAPVVPGPRSTTNVDVRSPVPPLPWRSSTPLMAGWNKTPWPSGKASDWR